MQEDLNKEPRKGMGIIFNWNYRINLLNKKRKKKVNSIIMAVSCHNLLPAFQVIMFTLLE